MLRVFLLCVAFTLPACQRPPMVLPMMFEAGRVDPLADVPEAERHHTQGIYFATDRRFDTHASAWRQYSRHRSDRLALGHAVVQIAPKGGWPLIRASALGEPDAKRYRPEMSMVRSIGQLESHRSATASNNGKTSKEITKPALSEQFLNELNTSLKQSAGKEITIFIHGFRTEFKNAMLTTAEYDLYTGGLGPFILYSWPSYNSIWEYSHDRDSVRYTTTHARRLVELLAEHINAGNLDANKINFIAHSTGAEVVGSVLRELALISHDSTANKRRQRWRIGSVLLVAPDISTDVARERVLKEDLDGMFDELVVYLSSRDRALRWASRILYRAPRLGAINEEDLSEEDRRWLEHAPGVVLIDVDSQPNRDRIHHSHHRFSAAAASDMILCLRSDLTPEERGLTRGEGEILWRFAEDYKQRVTEAAVKVYGEAAPPRQTP